MREHQQGFTLIELMIVVAIIGILAAVAIPAYQDFATRARVAEALQLSSSAKAGIAEFRETNGRWPADASSIGLLTIKGAYVKSVSVGRDSAGAHIHVATSIAEAPSGSITLSATVKVYGSVRWTCTTSGFTSGQVTQNCR